MSGCECNLSGSQVKNTEQTEKKSCELICGDIRWCKVFLGKYVWCKTSVHPIKKNKKLQSATENTTLPIVNIVCFKLTHPTTDLSPTSK